MIYFTANPAYNKQSPTGSLEVTDVTYTDVREDWIHRECFLTTAEMIYLRRGVLYLRVNGREYTVRKNSFLFLPQYSVIAGAARSDMPCAFYTVAFEEEGLVPPPCLLREITLPGSTFFADDLMKRVYELHLKRTPGRDANVKNALFYALVGEAKQAALEEADTTPLVERAIRLIDDNIRTIVTVDEVADAIGYNRDYLSRQFLASCGMTVKKYIDQKKLSVAKHLLVSSKMSVGQVARAVGFDDVQHFYKFFRYHEKVSPNQFRKLNG